MDIKNLSIVRQTFANTVFTHKVQEVAAESQERKAFLVKIVNILLVSIVLVLLFLQASNPTEVHFAYIAAGVTIAEVMFLIIQLYFNFEQRVVLHKNSALKYMGLRDKYRGFIADIMNENLSNAALLSKRDLLQQEYQVISDLAPQTGSKEYTEAQKRLNKRGAVQGEEFTWSDEEIDRFLPENLRLKNNHD
jgi:hypothetical protein